jgi:hypothetical protein
MHNCGRGHWDHCSKTIAVVKDSWRIGSIQPRKTATQVSELSVNIKSAPKPGRSRILNSTMTKQGICIFWIVALTRGGHNQELSEHTETDIKRFQACSESEAQLRVERDRARTQTRREQEAGCQNDPECQVFYTSIPYKWDVYYRLQIHETHVDDCEVLTHAIFDNSQSLGRSNWINGSGNAPGRSRLRLVSDSVVRSQPWGWGMNIWGMWRAVRLCKTWRKW